MPTFVSNVHGMLVLVLVLVLVLALELALVLELAGERRAMLLPAACCCSWFSSPGK